MQTSTKNTDKVMIRLPSDLHERLRERATANERSLNSEIVYALEQHVGAAETGVEATPASLHDDLLLGDAIARADRGQTHPLPHEALAVLRREIERGTSSTEVLARAGLSSGVHRE